MKNKTEVSIVITLIIMIGIIIFFIISFGGKRLHTMDSKLFKVNEFYKKYTYKDVVVRLEENEKYNYFVYINDIKTDIDTFSVIYIHFVGDMIFISTSETDIRTDTIHIYDNNGNKLYTISSFDHGMTLDYNKKELLYELIDNKIVFDGTRFKHNYIIQTGDKYEDSINPVTKDKYRNNCFKKEYENEKVYGKYEVEYLNDHKFSKIKNVGYTKLKDANISGISMCRDQ